VHFSLNNLKLCVSTAVKELEGLSHAKDLTIDINTKEPFEAMFDNALMLQAIINLLSNAIKFSPIGDLISVEIYKGEQWINESNQAALSVIVSDHGIGIPEDELECIFDKFIQSSKTMTASGGTGLGLSIVKEIVHLHNGHIYAVSPLKDGELGSSFCMTIPMLQDTL
jgi:signal transduction histidine kinase